MIFPCSSCGLCCQNISTIKELKNYDLGNGVCKYFDVLNKSCEIYNSRPEICQIDRMFQIKYNNYFTKEEFYIENAKVCNSLQEQYGLDKSFRIKIIKD
jgi:Fe-S-cluster containining protein